MKTWVRGSIALVGLLAAAPAGAQTYAGGEVSQPAMWGFGSALAVTAGEVLVGEAGNVTRPGLVYVYRKGADGWTEAATLRASDAENVDGFGAALALDGNTLLVGAGREGEGRGAYVFTRGTDGTWTEAERIRVDVPASDGFGTVVALSGDWAAVGAPGQNGQAGAVYVFRRGTAGWTAAAHLTAPGAAMAYGGSIALGEGRLFVGAPAAGNGTGKVFWYVLAGDQWQLQGEIAAPGLAEGDRYGATLAFDGTRLLVGAPGSIGGIGTVHVLGWVERQNRWASGGRLLPFAASRQDGFGRAVAFNGTEIWAGAPDGGAGAVQVLGDGGIAQRLALPQAGSFGASIGVSGDVAAIGAVGAAGGTGAAAIFERGADGRWALATRIDGQAETLTAVTGEKVECEGEGRAVYFACKNVDMLAYVPVSDISDGDRVRLNDVWGWTDPETNREYALVGRTDGTSFVDITDAENPRYLGDLPKTEGTPSATWRDIKVYENHAFIVADGAQEHGVQVFDLTRLRDVREPQTFTQDAHYDGVASSHNIVINEETGFAYAVGNRSGGETCGGGLHMIDVRDPKNPTFAGCFADPQTGRAGTGYSHDAQCIVYNGPDAEHQGREICFGANETMLSIADVTDKQSPVALARASYPNVGYSHQGWVTEDHRYFYMDDELDELQGSVNATRTLIWDIADLDDPQLVGEFMGTTQASDHNLYILDNTMYQSNYQAGLRVIDISDRDNPVEVGYFDTVPYGTNTPGFGGSWSNYPYFPSGTIIVTSGSEGLFILKKRPTRPVS